MPRTTDNKLMSLLDVPVQWRFLYWGVTNKSLREALESAKREATSDHPKQPGALACRERGIELDQDTIVRLISMLSDSPPFQQ